MKSPKHLDFIRSLPCIVCGDNTSTEAAHVRFADLRAAKPITGIGIKPDDCWTMPLCGKHHREQHTVSERVFWKRYSMDAIFICLALWRVTGDHDAALVIMQHTHWSEP